MQKGKEGEKQKEEWLSCLRVLDKHHAAGREGGLEREFSFKAPCFVDKARACVLCLTGGDHVFAWSYYLLLLVHFAVAAGLTVWKDLTEFTERSFDGCRFTTITICGAGYTTRWHELNEDHIG